MKVKTFNKNIFYLTFPSQKELVMTMCRMQEFYECDSVKLRNRIFTFEQFIDHYMEKDGSLDYFMMWSGFNIPGHVLDDFFDSFDLTQREIDVKLYTKKFRNKLYYVIATRTNDDETLMHELAHAYYYLNPVYKQQVDVLVRSMRKELKTQLTGVLKEMGYTNSVIVDEINAYMATSSYKYLKNELELELTRKDMKPFIDLAKTVFAGLA